MNSSNTHNQTKQVGWRSRRMAGAVALSLLTSLILTPRSVQATDAESTSLGDRKAALTREFEKGLVAVTDGITVAVGFGAANSTLIEGDDGVIIVDTMYGTEEAEDVRTAFEVVTNKPVSAIIFTHGHSDHIGGTEVFARGHEPEILARPPSSHSLAGYDALSEILALRGKRQFGSTLPPGEKIDGIAPVVRPTGGIGAGKLAPTREITSPIERLAISGIDIELIAAPGETADHQLVWLPDQRALICGDNFYLSFPNLYAIRGTAYRDVSRWIHTLDLMIELGAEHLISGHARPVSGAENIRRTLTGYRDAIDHVLSETLNGANRGLTPDELAATIKLPPPLADEPYLQEYYGVIAWSVRSIYNGYLGWFDGNPTNLFPLSPRDEATRMVRLVGSKRNLLDAAKNALAAGDHQWACQLVDYLLTLDPCSREAKTIKTAALNALALEQASSNARHYYLSVARELE